jgi:hypothetical protein
LVACIVCSIHPITLLSLDHLQQVEQVEFVIIDLMFLLAACDESFAPVIFDDDDDDQRALVSREEAKENEIHSRARTKLGDCISLSFYWLTRMTNPEIVVII